MNKYSIAFIAIFALIILSCKKENDTENPVITIYSPSENETFNSSDSVTIHFKAEDADLHEVGFTVTKKGTTDTLYNLAASHTHDNPLLVNQKYLIAVTNHTDATLTVQAEDHNGHKATKSVNFHIHPM